MNNIQLRKQRGQLPLHLPLEAAQAREDLVVSQSNKHAVEFLDSWPNWHVPLVILTGSKGSGKSHLSQIWAAQSNARFLTPSLSLPQEIDSNNFVVENLSQGSFNEVWLFHLLNSARASKNFVLLTARRPIVEWGIALPDLYSRLRAGHNIKLNAPDDILLAGILVKLFSDKQLQVDKSVIDYLLLHMERSLGFALHIVNEIDRISLSDRRSVTRPLVAKILQTIKG